MGRALQGSVGEMGQPGDNRATCYEFFQCEGEGTMEDPSSSDTSRPLSRISSDRPWSANPREHAPEELKAYIDLYYAIGQAVSIWAHLEQSVETMARMMYHKFDGQPLLSQHEIWVGQKGSEFPEALSRRLKLIEVVSRGHPEIEFWSDNMHLICKSVRKHNNLRTWIVHGRLVNHSTFFKTGVAQFQKSEAVKPKEFEIAKTSGFFVIVRALGGEFSRMTISIAEECERRQRARLGGLSNHHSSEIT